MYKRIQPKDYVWSYWNCPKMWEYNKQCYHMFSQYWTSNSQQAACVRFNSFANETIHLINRIDDDYFTNFSSYVVLWVEKKSKNSHDPKANVFIYSFVRGGNSEKQESDMAKDLNTASFTMKQNSYKFKNSDIKCFTTIRKMNWNGWRWNGFGFAWNRFVKYAQIWIFWNNKMK